MQISITRDGEEQIDGEVSLESGIQLAVYRRWDNTQWYLYSVNFAYGDYTTSVVDDTAEQFPIPTDSELGQALSRAVAQEASSWAPAL